MTFTNSTKVGYLPNSAISGAVTTFDLGQVMTRGGSVVAIASWTQDSKQNVDEYITFITSKGQVIIYQGNDPSTAPTFQQTGVYNLGTADWRGPLLYADCRQSVDHLGGWHHAVI